ncbi:MAG: OsmC family protein [Candidatus Aminicenantes bacterium]|nr:OsmC family protein [Candidatus Aminicenantes bacterium]
MSELPEIKVTFPGGLRVDAEYKGLVIKTDQPVYQGGDGTAPAPFDLFMVSIATCAGFYVVAFCQEREIPTDNAGVVMRMEKDPVSKLIGKITIEVLLPAEFPEKYKRAVVKAVDTCTVKLNIIKAPAFEIVTKFSG